MKVIKQKRDVKYAYDSSQPFFPTRNSFFRDRKISFILSFLKAHVKHRAKALHKDFYEWSAKDTVRLCLFWSQDITKNLDVINTEKHLYLFYVIFSCVMQLCADKLCQPWVASSVVSHVWFGLIKFTCLIFLMWTCLISTSFYSTFQSGNFCPEPWWTT